LTRAPKMKDNFAQKLRTLYLALGDASALRGSVGKAPMLDSIDFGSSERRVKAFPNVRSANSIQLL
jgi:hypothetical protein